MKLVELSINNQIVDVIRKQHTVLQMEHGTSAPAERVLHTTQFAKFSFNHPSVVLTADVFRFFTIFFINFVILKKSTRSYTTTESNKTPLLSWLIFRLTLDGLLGLTLGRVLGGLLTLLLYWCVRCTVRPSGELNQTEPMYYIINRNSKRTSGRRRQTY